MTFILYSIHYKLYMILDSDYSGTATYGSGTATYGSGTATYGSGTATYGSA